MERECIHGCFGDHYRVCVFCGQTLSQVNHSRQEFFLRYHLIQHPDG